MFKLFSNWSYFYPLSIAGPHITFTNLSGMLDHFNIVWVTSLLRRYHQIWNRIARI